MFPIFSKLALILFFSITPPQNVNDHEILLEEVGFWTKKKTASPDQFIYNIPLASAYTRLFDQDANIDDLLMATDLLEEVVYKTPLNQRSGILRSLAQNYISRHEFCKAQNIMMQAVALNHGMRENTMILFDLAMEMGNEADARTYLNELSIGRDFQYMIRRAKWEDAQGKLDQAILWLEDAKTLAEKEANDGNLYWIYSNLGDFYGHANNIEKSHAHYNKALALRPGDTYVQKAMLWKDYSLDKNYALTLDKLSSLATKSNDASLLLWQANTKSLLNDTKGYTTDIQSFIDIVSKERYAKMYRSYLVEIFLRKETYKPTLALKFANEEVNERPTAESYSLLAIALYHNGEKARAKFISDMFVIGRTVEPLALLRISNIDALDKEEKEIIISNLMDAEYELGPYFTSQITKP